MTVAPDSVLSPAVVAAIDDLELAARLVVEGMRTGGNRSPFHGSSTEFRQHRAYRPGDDLKYLDWKLFARSDRLYTRQFRETTDVPVMLVLDSSASMAFPQDPGGRDAGAGTSGVESAPVTKFRYAAVMAAALAYVASDQGNASGIMTMVNGGLRYLPARGGRLHLRALIAMIDGLVPSGHWEPVRVIDRAAQLLKRRGIVVVISDLYDDERGTARALRRVTRHGHDVSLLHVLSPDERSLSDDGQAEFVDLESGERRIADPGVIAAAYRSSVEQFTGRWRIEALRAGLDYAGISTATPPARALREFLQRRGARRDANRSHRPVIR